MRQFAHQIDETLAFFAQAVGHGDAHIFKEQFGSIGFIHADFVEVAAAFETFAVGFNQDNRHALIGRLNFGVGLNTDEDQVGILAIGDVGFAAVDDIMIAVFLGSGLHPLKIAAGAGFSHRNGGDNLARDHFWQPMLLLFFAAVAGNIVHNDIGLQREACGYAAIISRLFIDNSVIAKVEAKAAIFHRNGGAEHADFASLGPNGFGHNALFLPLLCVRRDFLLQKLAHRLTEGLMIFIIGGAWNAIE